MRMNLPQRAVSNWRGFPWTPYGSACVTGLPTLHLPIAPALRCGGPGLRLMIARERLHDLAQFLTASFLFKVDNVVRLFLVDVVFNQQRGTDHQNEKERGRAIVPTANRP